ncbi:MAG: sucrose phosphorylase [Burkholderiales bacterium]|nr:sucrose phosphorylase [Burkholderiales bacterium]MDE2276089.1 sucrose phosphorylase [Burkholderiales bacterium]
MKNQVQLITYVDRLGGGDLAALRALLQGPLAGVFGGVHLLPFFHAIDGADAGFDPIDHLRVDPRLGGWDDIRRLAADTELMADVIVNHVSSDSPQFQDYAARGEASPHAGLFLDFERVFPQGARAADLLALYRPRPGLPFTALTLAGGVRKLLWTTFTPQQLDIDVRHPQGRDYLQAILQTFAANGIRMVRLDAVGYAIKRAGTSCFMLPETFDFIAEFAGQARALGIEVLVEIHAYYQRQIEIAQRVDRVYDFALPPLVLHALFFGTAEPLKAWARVRPANALTVLDTHDGIGIIDIGADAADRQGRPGLVPPHELDALVERIHANSGGASRQATGAAASNLDLYQVNCTFYDALARDDLRYLLARAIQFFLPGVPQVYYVGLLAGENDMALLARTGVGRDINRHRYSPAEIEAALARPVVARLLALIRLRNAHPAFGGTFTLQPSAPQVLSLRWQQGADWAEFELDLATLAHHLAYSGPLGERCALALA